MSDSAGRRHRNVSPPPQPQATGRKSKRRKKGRNSFSSSMNFDLADVPLPPMPGEVVVSAASSQTPESSNRPSSPSPVLAVAPVTRIPDRKVKLDLFSDDAEDEASPAKPDKPPPAPSSSSSSSSQVAASLLSAKQSAPKISMVPSGTRLGKFQMAQDSGKGKICFQIKTTKRLSVFSAESDDDSGSESTAPASKKLDLPSADQESLRKAKAVVQTLLEGKKVSCNEESRNQEMNLSSSETAVMPKSLEVTGSQSVPTLSRRTRRSRWGDQEAVPLAAGLPSHSESQVDKDSSQASLTHSPCAGDTQNSALESRSSKRTTGLSGASLPDSHDSKVEKSEKEKIASPNHAEGSESSDMLHSGQQGRILRSSSEGHNRAHVDTSKSRESHEHKARDSPKCRSRTQDRSESEKRHKRDSSDDSDREERNDDRRFSSRRPNRHRDQVHRKSPDFRPRRRSPYESDRKRSRSKSAERKTRRDSESPMRRSRRERSPESSEVEQPRTSVRRSKRLSDESYRRESVDSKSRRDSSSETESRQCRRRLRRDSYGRDETRPVSRTSKRSVERTETCKMREQRVKQNPSSDGEESDSEESSLRRSRQMRNRDGKFRRRTRSSSNDDKVHLPKRSSKLSDRVDMDSEDRASSPEHISLENRMSRKETEEKHSSRHTEIDSVARDLQKNCAKSKESRGIDSSRKSEESEVPSDCALGMHKMYSTSDSHSRHDKKSSLNSKHFNNAVQPVSGKKCNRDSSPDSPFEPEEVESARRQLRSHSGGRVSDAAVGDSDRNRLFKSDSHVARTLKESGRDGSRHQHSTSRDIYGHHLSHDLEIRIARLEDTQYYDKNGSHTSEKTSVRKSSSDYEVYVKGDKRHPEGFEQRKDLRSSGRRSSSQEHVLDDSEEPRKRNSEDPFQRDYPKRKFKEAENDRIETDQLQIGKDQSKGQREYLDDAISSRHYKSCPLDSGFLETEDKNNTKVESEGSVLEQKVDESSVNQLQIDAVVEREGKISEKETKHGRLDVEDSYSVKVTDTAVTESRSSIDSLKCLQGQITNVHEKTGKHGKRKSRWSSPDASEEKTLKVQDGSDEARENRCGDQQVLSEHTALTLPSGSRNSIASSLLPAEKTGSISQTVLNIPCDKLDTTKSSSERVSGSEQTTEKDLNPIPGPVPPPVQVPGPVPPPVFLPDPLDTFPFPVPSPSIPSSLTTPLFPALKLPTGTAILADLPNKIPEPFPSAQTPILVTEKYELPKSPDCKSTPPVDSAVQPTTGNDTPKHPDVKSVFHSSIFSSPFPEEGPKPVPPPALTDSEMKVPFLLTGLPAVLPHPLQLAAAQSKSVEKSKLPVSVPESIPLSSGSSLKEEAKLARQDAVQRGEKASPVRSKPLHSPDAESTVVVASIKTSNVASTHEKKHEKPSVETEPAKHMPQDTQPKPEEGMKVRTDSDLGIGSQSTLDRIKPSSQLPLDLDSIPLPPVLPSKALKVDSPSATLPAVTKSPTVRGLMETNQPSSITSPISQPTPTSVTSGKVSFSFLRSSPKPSVPGLLHPTKQKSWSPTITKPPVQKLSVPSGVEPIPEVDEKNSTRDEMPLTLQTRDSSLKVPRDSPRSDIQKDKQVVKAEDEPEKADTIPEPKVVEQQFGKFSPVVQSCCPRGAGSASESGFSSLDSTPVPLPLSHTTTGQMAEPSIVTLAKLPGVNTTSALHSGAYKPSVAADQPAAELASGTTEAPSFSPVPKPQPTLPPAGDGYTSVLPCSSVSGNAQLPSIAQTSVPIHQPVEELGSAITSPITVNQSPKSPADSLTLLKPKQMICPSSEPSLKIPSVTQLGISGPHLVPLGVLPSPLTPSPVALSGNPVPDGAPSGIPVPILTPSGIPPPSVTPSGIPPPSVTPSGIPPPSVTPSGIPPPPVTPSGIPPPSVTPSGINPPSVTPSGIPPLAVATSGIPPPSVTPSGIPPPSVTPSGIPPLAVATSGIPPPSVAPAGIPAQTVEPLETCPSSAAPLGIPLPTVAPRGISPPSMVPLGIPLPPEKPVAAPYPPRVPAASSPPPFNSVVLKIPGASANPQALSVTQDTCLTQDSPLATAIQQFRGQPRPTLGPQHSAIPPVTAVPYGDSTSLVGAPGTVLPEVTATPRFAVAQQVITTLPPVVSSTLKDAHVSCGAPLEAFSSSNLSQAPVTLPPDNTIKTPSGAPSTLGLPKPPQTPQGIGRFVPSSEALALKEKGIFPPKKRGFFGLPDKIVFSGLGERSSGASMQKRTGAEESKSPVADSTTTGSAFGSFSSQVRDVGMERIAATSSMTESTVSGWKPFGSGDRSEVDSSSADSAVRIADSSQGKGKKDRIQGTNEPSDSDSRSDSEPSGRRRSGRIRSIEERKEKEKSEQEDREGCKSRKEKERAERARRREKEERDRRGRRRYDEDSRGNDDRRSRDYSDRRRSGRDYRRDYDDDRSSDRSRNRDRDRSRDSRYRERRSESAQKDDLSSSRKADVTEKKEEDKDADIISFATPSTSDGSPRLPTRPQIVDIKKEETNYQSPGKLKSRWRRTSEAEGLAPICLTPPPPPPPALQNADVRSTAPTGSRDFVCPPPPGVPDIADCEPSSTQSGSISEAMATDVKQEVKPEPTWSHDQEAAMSSSTEPLKDEEMKENQAPEEKPLQEEEKQPEEPPYFERIIDNIYVGEKKRSKQMREVKRMLCDCTTSAEDRESGMAACGEDCLNRMLMIECGNRCPCGDYCTNKRFQRHQYLPTKPLKTDSKGWGLFAAEDLEPGQFVMEYIGEVLDYKEFKSRTKQYAKTMQEHCYFMALNADEVIDATIKGNISRFINHSCGPNCETQKWTVNGELRVGFFTKEFIREGEELTFDYHFERYGKEAQKCYCGADSCRGFLGGTKSTPLKSKKRLAAEKKKRELFADQMLDEEIEEMTSLEGMKNKEHVLKLCRLMVRAESDDHRSAVLNIIQGTSEPGCLRLFLDYHGLPLLWSWMADIGIGGSRDLKLQILNTLSLLPISNKTILKESKILSVVERWAVEMEQGEKETEPEGTNEPASRSGTPILPSGEERAPKKRVKFADETSSDSELSESSRVSSSQNGSENSTKTGGILKYPGSTLSFNSAAEKQATDPAMENSEKPYADFESVPSENQQMVDSSSKQDSGNESVSQSDTQASGKREPDPQESVKSEQACEDQGVQAQGISETQTSSESELSSVHVPEKSEPEECEKATNSDDVVSPACESKDGSLVPAADKPEDTEGVGACSKTEEGVESISTQASSIVKEDSEISKEASCDFEKSDVVAEGDSKEDREARDCGEVVKTSGEVKEVTSVDSVTDIVQTSSEMSEKVDDLGAAESLADTEMTVKADTSDSDNQSGAKEPNLSDTGESNQSENFVNTEPVDSAKVDKSKDENMDQSEAVKRNKSGDENTDQTDVVKPQETDSEKYSVPDSKDNTGDGKMEKSDENETAKADSSKQDKVEKSDENEMAKADSSKQDNSEAAKTGSKTDPSEIVSLASSLLKKWSVLKELFRIPKKERVEERKRTERELDRERDWDRDRDRYDRKRRHDSPDRGYYKSSRHRSRGDRDRDRRRDSDSSRRTLLPTPPKMSKEKRRQLFEAQVKAKDEKMAELQRQQEAYLQQQQAQQLGGDPGYPTDQYYQDPNYVAAIQDPNFLAALQQDPNFADAVRKDPNFMAALAADPNYAAALQALHSAPIADPNYTAAMPHDPNYPAEDPGYTPVQHDPNYGTAVPVNPNYQVTSLQHDPNYVPGLQADPNYAAGLQADPNYPVPVHDPNYSVHGQHEVNYVSSTVPTTLPSAIPASHAAQIPGVESTGEMVGGHPVATEMTHVTHPQAHVIPVETTTVPQMGGVTVSQPVVDGRAQVVYQTPTAPYQVQTTYIAAPTAAPKATTTTYIPSQTQYISSQPVQPVQQVYYTQTPQGVMVQHTYPSAPAAGSAGQVVQVQHLPQHVQIHQQLVTPEVVEDVPPPPSPPRPKAIKLPPNWKTAKDPEGKVYYYHSVTKQTQWDPPSWDGGEHDDMDLGTPTHDEPAGKSKKKTTMALADTSSEIAKRSKESFRNKMSQFIVTYLNPFRKPDCRLGRITSSDDFKHLARKLTHHVLAKELKHCRHAEDLEVNENVKAKAKDFVKKYMSKFGPVYKKAHSPQNYDDF